MGLDEAFDEVVAAARMGAEWAITVLYRELQPPLLAYLRSQERAEAEDLASEVWQGVGEGLSRFEGDEASFRAWVFTIARHRVIDWRRRRNRRPAAVAGEERLAFLAGTEDTASAAIASVASEEAIRRITELLPADQAEVVILRVLGDLDADQVGHILGKRAGTVRVLQHRALRRLAEVFSQEGVTP
jgi:RNA polymerase sigma-70 factor (ECF subfamily)